MTILAAGSAKSFPVDGLWDLTPLISGSIKFQIKN